MYAIPDVYRYSAYYHAIGDRFIEYILTHQLQAHRIKWSAFRWWETRHRHSYTECPAAPIDHCFIDQTDVPGDGNSLALQQTSESDGLQSSITPGSTVPSEVLELIMDLSTYDVSSDVAVGPLRFTHVSRLWRQTAIGLPSLWTNIQVNISTNRTNRGLVDLID